MPILPLWLLIGSLLDVAGLRMILRLFDSLAGWISLGLLLSFPTVDPRGPKRMIARRTPAGLSGRDGSFGFTLHAEKASMPSTRDHVRPGDVILCNQVAGLVDCLYVWWQWSPRIGGRWCRLAVAYSVMYGSISNSSSSSSISGNSSSSDSSSSGVFPATATCVSLYFPEGARTNGRGILRFPATFSIPSTAAAGARVHLLCLKYQCAAIDPTAQGFLGTLWQLSIFAGQLKNSLTGRMITAAALSALFGTQQDEAAAAATTAVEDFDLRLLQQLMAALGHVKALGLTAADKVSFERFLRG